MGTTSEKLTYLNTTKTKIKEAINITGANITNETFRAYETKLKNSLVDIWTNGADVIWNNWEKTIGSGESITLNNTIEAKMKLDLFGNTSQSGTPTPESPQPINVVSGNNTITISNSDNTQSQNYNINLGTTELCKIGDYKDSIFKSSGKNLVYEYHKSNNIVYLNETSRYEDYIFEAGTYTFSYKDSNNCTLSIKDTTGTQTSLGTGKVITFTSNYDFNIFLYRSGITVEELSEVMLEKGSVTTPTYEPFGTDWYIKKEIGKVVLDGSEDWVSGSYGTNSWVLSNTISVAFDTNELQIMTRKFKGIKHADRNTNDNVIYTSSNTQFWLRNTPYTTKAEVQSGMSGEAIYYILNTPTYTKITDTTLLEQLEATKLSYQGETNINQVNNDKPFIINASAMM